MACCRRLDFECDLNRRRMCIITRGSKVNINMFKLCTFIYLLDPYFSHLPVCTAFFLFFN